MVKCKDCGLLGAREFLTRALLEVDEGFREKAERGHGTSNKVLYFDKPICAAMAVHLGSEARDAGVEQTLVVLHRERVCNSFMPWQQGFTPKEHLEMRARQDERQWHQQRVEEDRKWREEQAAQARAWRKEDLDRHAAAASEEHIRHLANLRMVMDATRWNVRSVLLAAAISMVATLLAVWLAKWIGEN